MNVMAGTRREFIAGAIGLGTVGGLGGARKVFAQPIARVTDQESPTATEEPLFKISIAQWSFHRMIQAGNFDNLSFPSVAARAYKVDAIEWVNQFFKDKATDAKYLRDMLKHSNDAGVRSLLIMIDGEGPLAAPDEATRAAAIERHRKWVVAAWSIGCHSIRVNAAGAEDWDEGMKHAADSLNKLATYAAQYGISVIVENHGGLSSNGTWLAGVMKAADHPGVGTLPDFGNFHIKGDEWYDRYKGVAELMPWAKAVSAKSHAFDENGNETKTDYKEMMQIVLDAGYHGYVGIEYEGSEIPEQQGVTMTLNLLERVRNELS